MELLIGNKNNKSCIPPYLHGHEKFGNLCFASVPQTVWVSCAFVYSAVDVNKIVGMMIF